VATHELPPSFFNWLRYQIIQGKITGLSVEDVEEHARVLELMGHQVKDWVKKWKKATGQARKGNNKKGKTLKSKSQITTYA